MIIAVVAGRHDIEKIPSGKVGVRLGLHKHDAVLVNPNSIDKICIISEHDIRMSFTGVNGIVDYEFDVVYQGRVWKAASTSDPRTIAKYSATWISIWEEVPLYEEPEFELFSDRLYGINPICRKKILL